MYKVNKLGKGEEKKKDIREGKQMPKGIRPNTSKI